MFVNKWMLVKEYCSKAQANVILLTISHFATTFQLAVIWALVYYLISANTLFLKGPQQTFYCKVTLRVHVNLGPVHTEMRIAVNVNILYHISVLSRRIRRFWSLKQHFFHRPKVDKSENNTFAFSCVQPICRYIYIPHISALIGHRYVT